MSKNNNPKRYPVLDATYEHGVRAEGFNLIVGVDEAGRGPLAGPVVASAVAFKEDSSPSAFRSKINDSKALSAVQREKAFHEIHEKAHVGVGIVSEAVIDRVNILEATFLAMTKAVEHLMRRRAMASGPTEQPATGTDVCLLIDGSLFRSDLPYAYRTVVKGDQTVLSIACASIIAKVTRDRILNIYDAVFPQYGFRDHKGYPTRAHRQAIGAHGLSLIHRRTYKHS